MFKHTCGHAWSDSQSSHLLIRQICRYINSITIFTQNCSTHKFSDSNSTVKMTKWWGKNVWKCIFPLRFFSFLISCQYQQITYIRFLKIFHIAIYVPKKSENDISNKSKIFLRFRQHIFTNFFFLGQTVFWHH